MAEKGLKQITTVPLFKSLVLGVGETGTSGVIDLREIAQEGKFSIRATVVAGTTGTAGTSILSYSGGNSLDGTFIVPAAASVIGTWGTGKLSDILSFTPVLTPFMKIIVTQSGTNFDSVLTAELNVQ